MRYHCVEHIQEYKINQLLYWYLKNWQSYDSFKLKIPQLDQYNLTVGYSPISMIMQFQMDGGAFLYFNNS